MLNLLETILGGIILEAAVVGIIVLLFRLRGKRLPDWLPVPQVIRRWIDRMIDPDPRRLDRLISYPRKS